MEERAKERPAGYLEAMEAAAAQRDEAGLWFEPATLPALQALWGKFDPGWVELAANYAIAVAKWVAAGRPIVDEATFQKRLAACQTCDAWSGTNCRLCGCPRKKLEWATEKCPHPLGPKWD